MTPGQKSALRILKANARRMYDVTSELPENVPVDALCRTYGYGAVMEAASRMWMRARLKDNGPVGHPFVVGPCVGTVLADDIEWQKELERRAKMALAAEAMESRRRQGDALLDLWNEFRCQMAEDVAYNLWEGGKMGDKTGIEWADHTFNPWWGCVRVSPACEHCYAETFAHRYGFDVWGVKAPRRFFGDAHWREPVKWNAAAEKEGRRARVFCASMADVFEERRELDEHRERLWALIASTPWLDWQLLTKRIEFVRAMVPASWMAGAWPRNVWIGTTVEDQAAADERIPLLLQTPAAVRFLSCEPLLAAVDLSPWLDRRQRLSWRQIGIAPLGAFCHHAGCAEESPCPDHETIDWVIVGGESGAGARPMALEWARSVVSQCVEAGVAPFVKQLGSHGRRDKGGDLADMPEDLRVRAFPEVH